MNWLIETLTTRETRYSNYWYAPIQHNSNKLLKKAEVRHPNQINRIRSSLYGEWKWRVISEGAILVVVDWMQNWMRSHCFYCMDPGNGYQLPHFYFVGAHTVWMVWLNVTIVVVTDAGTVFLFGSFLLRDMCAILPLLNIIAACGLQFMV